MIRTSCILLTVCLFLCGCASTHTAKTKEPGTPDFRVWMDRTCKFSDLEQSERADTEAAPIVLALAGAIAPKIIEYTVDAGAGYLEKKKSDLAASYSSRGSNEFFESRGKGKVPLKWISCISIARGNFGEPLVAQDVDHWKKTKLDPMRLTGVPNFYADLHIRYSRDGSAFQIRPRYIELRKTAAKRIGKDKKKDLLITGYFEAPHLSADDSSTNRFGSFQLKVPAVSEGGKLSKTDLDNIMSQWIPMPQVPSSTGKNDKGEEVTRYGYLPFTLFVTVQESEDAGDLLLAAVKIAADSKADVTKVLSDAVAEKLKKDKEEEEEAPDGN